MGSSRSPAVMSGLSALALSLAAPAAGAQLTPETRAIDPTHPPEPASGGPTRALTMAQALEYAHAHQPAIRAALALVSARMEEATIPGAQWLPAVGVTAQIFAMTANNTTATFVQVAPMDIPRIGASAATATGSFSPYASTLVGAGLSQEVFDFGRIGAQRAAADARVEVEKHRADTQRLDIDFNVEEAFFAVAAAEAIVQAADDAYERARVHRDLAKRGVDSGLRSPIDLTRAEADLDRYDIGRVRARGGVAIAQSVLAAAIGAPDAGIDVAGEAPSPEHPFRGVNGPDMPALAEAVALAQRRDPRLAETLAELAAAEEHTRAVGAELRPDISLTATVSGRAGGAPPSSGPSAREGGWVPNVPNWDAGIVLSWPLFDGTIAARRSAARAMEQVRREDIDVLRERVVAQVRQAYVAVEVATRALDGLRVEVSAARANYDQADARFRAGIGNAVELADAETVRTDAEIQLALGVFDLTRARAAFGRAIAEGL
jgi:outer membrane protein